MKNKIIKITEKVSKYNTNSEDLIKQVYYKNEYLVDAEINIIDEDVEIEYDLKKLDFGSNILKNNFLNKLKFLINCSKLQELEKEYSIDLDLKNIYYDFNYQAKLLDRNFLNEDLETIHQDFLKKYKCLIGQVINPKHSYKDYYEGGQDLFENNKITKVILELNSVEGVVEKLINCYESENQYISQNKVTVSKKNHKIYKITAIVSSVIMVVSITYSSILSFNMLPTNKKYLEASNAFISQKYQKTIETLSETEYENMPKETKYILAVSYIYSEAFNIEQKNVILSNITPQTDSKFYDYWISIGRLNYDQAIDTAKQLGDDEYLAYAYLKQLNDLKNNTKISGEEKQSKINTVNSDLEKVMEKINKNNNDKGMLE